jgi:hypothetical protein
VWRLQEAQKESEQERRAMEEKVITLAKLK